jgi:hypothetical protein
MKKINQARVLDVVLYPAERNESISPMTSTRERPTTRIK